MSALVSEKELQAGAIQAYAEVIGKEQKEGDLNANPAMTQRVRAIAARLIPRPAPSARMRQGGNGKST